jgi:hypothetical protein
MEQYREKVTYYLNKIRLHKWLAIFLSLIIIIPLLVFTIRLFSNYPSEIDTGPKNNPILSPSAPTSTTQQTTHSPTGANIHPTPTSIAKAVVTGGQIEETWPTDLNDFYGDANPSTLQGVQKVENLSDGTKRYTATSANPARPNMIIAKDDKTVYQRSIPSKGADIPFANFVQLFGQPDKRINGPDFYENTTLEYIYAKKGVAIVVDKQTEQVVEQHFFRSTTVDNYINSFGNDGSPLK